MRCRQARDRIMACLDSQTDPKADRFLEQHMDGCAQCRLEWEKLRPLDALFRSSAVHPAPRNLKVQVMHRIERRQQARRAVVAGITLALGTAALAALTLIPVGLGLFGSLGAAPAVLAGAGETLTHLLVLFAGITRILVALLDQFALPLAALAVGSVFAAVVLNGLWIAALRKLRVAG